jgi:hypothetical protein
MNKIGVMTKLGIGILLVLVPVSTLAGKLVRKNYNFTASTKKPLRLRLEIDAGQIEIQPGRDDRDVSLEFRFDERRHDLSVDFDEDENYLKVYFEIDDWFKDDDHKDGYSPRMTLELPTDVQIDMNCKIKAGECDVELGGLYLSELNLRILAGKTRLMFSSPNRDKLKELDIDAKFGELRLEKLGNANFEYARVNGTIGSISVDLSADRAVKMDREVDISLNIGETRIYLPEDEAVRFSVSKFLFFSSLDIPTEFYSRGKYYYSDNYEDSSHKLELAISPGLGTLDIRMRD